MHFQLLLGFYLLQLFVFLKLRLVLQKLAQVSRRTFLARLHLWGKRAPLQLFCLLFELRLSLPRLRLQLAVFYVLLEPGQVDGSRLVLLRLQVLIRDENGSSTEVDGHHLVDQLLVGFVEVLVCRLMLFFLGVLPFGLGALLNLADWLHRLEPSRLLRVDNVLVGVSEVAVVY